MPDMIRAENIQYISEVVDEIALEKPVDWESFNYESVKELAVVEALEHYNEIINNPEMSSEEKHMTIVSIMAYLMMENAQLWIKIKKENL